MPHDRLKACSLNLCLTVSLIYLFKYFQRSLQSLSLSYHSKLLIFIPSFRNHYPTLEKSHLAIHLGEVKIYSGYLSKILTFISLFIHILLEWSKINSNSLPFCGQVLFLFARLQRESGAHSVRGLSHGQN